MMVQCETGNHVADIQGQNLVTRKGVQPLASRHCTVLQLVLYDTLLSFYASSREDAYYLAKSQVFATQH